MLVKKKKYYWNYGKNRDYGEPVLPLRWLR